MTNADNLPAPCDPEALDIRLVTVFRSSPVTIVLHFHPTDQPGTGPGLPGLHSFGVIHGLDLDREISTGNTSFWSAFHGIGVDLEVFVDIRDGQVVQTAITQYAPDGTPTEAALSLAQWTILDDYHIEVVLDESLIPGDGFGIAGDIFGDEIYDHYPDDAHLGYPDGRVVPNELPIAYEAAPPADVIVKTLRTASSDGESDPVLVFSDDFSSPDWSVFEDQFTKVSYADGAYEVAVNTSNSTAYGLPNRAGSYSDFFFQIDARAFGPGDNNYGIIFRDQGGGWYQFTVASNGFFRADKFVEFTPVELLPWTESPWIARGEGELNTLAVLALGSNFLLYINGQEVASFSDPDRTAGRIALVVDSYDQGGVRIVWDNAEVWVPAG